MARVGTAAAIVMVVAATLVSVLVPVATRAEEATRPSAPAEARERLPGVVFDTSYGAIEIELDPERAPLHCAQMLSLVREGFYDGTTFHRVIPGYLIQGGDPNSKDEDPDNDGHGGLEDRRLTPEFSDKPFQRGSVGMARDYRLDGASCQFFIMLGKAAHLDGQHTLIGRVRRGMEVVDQIAALPTDPRGRPLASVPVRARVVETDDRRPRSRE